MRRWFFIVGLLVILLIGSGVGIKLITTAGELLRIQGLLPPVRKALQTLREKLAGVGIRTAVRSTRRTPTEQAELVALGKSDTSQSFHVIGRAVDVYVFGPDDKLDLDGKYEDRYLTMHKIAATLGFTNVAYDAAWKPKYLKSGARDLGHLQFTGGMTFAQAQAFDSKVA